MFSVPTGYWNDKNNINEFLNYIKQQENIQDDDGWYSVRRSHLL